MSADTGSWMRRVNAALHKVIAAEVESLKDPRLGFVTITAVDTSPDLRNAIVSYAVLGDDEQRSETAKALAAATPRVQRAVGRAVRLKFTPHLTFRLDDRADRGARLSAILRRIEEGDDDDGT
jgi:ribosome-binding factor A